MGIDTQDETKAKSSTTGDSVLKGLKRCEHRFLRGRRPRFNRAFERLRATGKSKRITGAEVSTKSNKRADARSRGRRRNAGGEQRTYEVNSEVNSSAGGAGRPSASVAGRNSNAASMLAIVIHTVSHARARPGHLRRPNPNAASGSGARAAGSESRKRSGLNFEGSG